MNDPFSQYPYLKTMVDKYKKAQNTNAKQIVFTPNEMSLILADLTKLSLSHAENIKSMKTIEQFIMMMIADQDDNGFK